MNQISQPLNARQVQLVVKESPGMMGGGKSGHFSNYAISVRYLLVKSPGSACLQPGILARAVSRASTTEGPPWVWNSTESSPVKLSGAKRRE